MATMTMNRQGAAVMSSDSDAGLFSVLGLATNILSLVIGGIGVLILRGFAFAASEARAKGELAGWQTMITKDILALEAKLTLRIVPLEARYDRIDEQLRAMPTRDEMNETLEKTERHIVSRIEDIMGRQPQRRIGD